MKNKRQSLIAALIISAVFVVAASILFGLLGANLSFNWSGGNEIKIVCNDSEIAKDAKIRAISLFNQNGVEISSIENLTNGADEIVVVKTQQKNIQDNVKAEISSKLNNVEGATTEGFVTVYSSFKTPVWTIPVTIVLLLMAAAVVIYFITHRIADMLVMFIGSVLSSALMLSLVIISRTQIGENSVVALFAGLLIQTLLAFALLIRVQRAQKSVLKNESNLKEICSKVSKQSFDKEGILIIVTIMTAIMCVFIGTTSIANFGYALLIGVLVTLFVSHQIVLPLKVAFEESFENRYNKRMQETETPIVDKKQPDKKESKPKAKPTAQKVVVNKKRKRRNGSSDNKVVV